MTTSTAPQDELPMKWIKKIFGEMHGHYGSRFLNMWRTGILVKEGPDKDCDAGVLSAQDAWARKLGGFADRPDAIGSVLNNLPESPPTLPEFQRLLREAARRIGDDTNRISYTPTPEEAERLREMTKKAADALAIKQNGGRDFKAWAKKLRVQYLRGERLSAVQQRTASEALDEVWMNGTCKPIENAEHAEAA